MVIGRYRLSKTLGIGAFGKVKREYIEEACHQSVFVGGIEVPHKPPWNSSEAFVGC